MEDMVYQGHSNPAPTQNVSVSADPQSLISSFNSCTQSVSETTILAPFLPLGVGSRASTQRHSVHDTIPSARSEVSTNAVITLQISQGRKSLPIGLRALTFTSCPRITFRPVWDTNRTKPNAPYLASSFSISDRAHCCDSSSNSIYVRAGFEEHNQISLRISSSEEYGLPWNSFIRV